MYEKKTIQYIVSLEQNDHFKKVVKILKIKRVALKSLWEITISRYIQYFHFFVARL